MKEASQPCSQKISVSIPSVIFLPESADGPTPSGSPGSRTSNAGLGRARASRSPARGRSSAWRTTGTCGRNFSASSRSADLSLSLVSRLRRRLPMDGSTLFLQGWRRKATPAGRWYWAHTASALPTSDGDSTGEASWGTPTTADKLGRFGENQTRLAQWPTPNIGDSYSRSLNTWKIPAMGQVHSQQLIHWATPQASDYVEGARTAKGSRQKCLGRDLKELGSGTDVSGSPAATEKPGRLNPELSRWLMGFPAGWSCLKATATRSCRKSRRSSSRPVSTLYWACQRPRTRHWGSGQVWDRICKQFGTPDAAFGKTDGIPEGIAAYDLSNGYNWKSLPLADNVHEFGYWDPPYDRMYRPEGLEIWRVCRRLAILHPIIYPTSWFAGGRREAMVAVTMGPFKMMRCVQIFCKDSQFQIPEISANDFGKLATPAGYGEIAT
jgi:hypothetical protein